MSRVIDAVLRLRDEFTQPMKKSLDLMTQASKAGERTRKSVDKIGRGFEDAGKKLTAAVTVPLVGLGTVSYKTFESVDKQLKLVEATMGESKYATADLSASLQEAMTQSIFSMQEGGQALVNFARQGWDAAQAADMLTPSLNLAAGTTTDLDSVTSGLGNTLKAFGASAAEATHYADMFTVAQAQANTNVQELFDAMSIAGPIAKTVGWDFEDIATLVGAFGDQSISASEGANALKTGLSRLSGGNSEANKAMAALGISLYDDEGHMKSMVDVIDTLQGSFNGLTEQEQMYYASKLFGANQMSKWLALINGPTADALGDMRDNITNASGNAQEAADALMTPMEKLSSTFDVFKYSVGQALAGAVVPFIDKLTEMVDAFRKMSPEQQQQIVKWAMMAAAAGPVLMVFGRLIRLGSSLFGALSKVRGAFQFVVKAGGPLKALAATLGAPLGIVIGVLAAIAAIVLVVITHLDQFKAAAQQVMTVVGPAIQNLMAAFQGFGTTVSPVLTMIGDLVANVLCAAFVAAGYIIAGVINGIAIVINTLSAIVSGVVSTVSAILSGDWSAAWAEGGGVVQGAVQIISSVIGGIAGTLKGVVGVITGIINGDWTQVWNSMGSIATSVVGTIRGALQGIINVINGIIGAAKKAGEALSNMGKGQTNGGLHGVGVNASGTPNWKGGWTTVGEKGPELMNLPSGTQIIPHESALNRVTNSTPDTEQSVSRDHYVKTDITIPKLADTIVVREDADIDRIAAAMVRKIQLANAVKGGLSYSGNMA